MERPGASSTAPAGWGVGDGGKWPHAGVGPAPAGRGHEAAPQSGCTWSGSLARNEGHWGAPCTAEWLCGLRSHPPPWGTSLRGAAAPTPQGERCAAPIVGLAGPPERGRAPLAPSSPTARPLWSSGSDRPRARREPPRDRAAEGQRPVGPADPAAAAPAAGLHGGSAQQGGPGARVSACRPTAAGPLALATRAHAGLPPAGRPPPRSRFQACPATPVAARAARLDPPPRGPGSHPRPTHVLPLTFRRGRVLARHNPSPSRLGLRAGCPLRPPSLSGRPPLQVHTR